MKIFPGKGVGGGNSASIDRNVRLFPNMGWGRLVDPRFSTNFYLYSLPLLLRSKQIGLRLYPTTLRVKYL